MQVSLKRKGFLMRLFASSLGLQFIFLSICLQAAQGDVSYNKDIRPLLSDRCFACHGPDDGKREGNFRLLMVY
jgi:hypothetical protein